MKKFPIKPMLLASKILCYVFVVLMGIAYVGGQILDENSTAINSFFHIETQIRVDPEEGGSGEPGNEDDNIYYKTVHENFEDVLTAAEKTAQEVVEEGSALLLNREVSKNGVKAPALPLGEGAKVSLFSASSVYPAISGTGSGGGDKTKAGNSLFYDGFTAAGLSVNKTLYDWYVANKSYCRISTGSGTSTVYSINDAKWEQIGTSAKTEKADAAIFILARMGGEGNDLKRDTGNKSDMTNGDYLALSPSELDVLKNLKAEKAKGTFGSIVVVMNSAYQVCGVDDPALDVDAILWTGSVGDRGTYAIGNILAGKVNPSGKLVDTFWKTQDKNPANINFGDFSYTGITSGSEIKKDYVVYQEGIYVGYRYTETRYEDAVTGRAKTGNFNYYDTVSYPFGYGMSYTDFTYSGFNVTYDKPSDSYHIAVTVTNTGDVAGKEAVQIYVQKPFTEYDVRNKIEKASVEFVKYGKTGLLAPGAAQTLNLTVKRRDLTSYDAYGAGTYILDAGKYYFTAARDAHDAVNNILRARDDLNIQESNLSAEGNTTLGSSSLVRSFTVNNMDAVTYSKSANGTRIVNRFDDADILRFEPESTNASNFKYLSRTDWEGTMPTEATVLARTTRMDEMYDLSQGSGVQRDTEVKDYPTTRAENGLKLIDLRAYSDGEPIPYDDPLWEEFLDQLSFDQMATLLSDGFRRTVGIDEIGKPETVDHNGSCGIKHFNVSLHLPDNMLADPEHPRVKSNTCNNYPCNSTVAATMNDDLIKRLGEQWGEEALWVGYNGLYGPGANIHRSSYNGRNFEYYSEDPYLTGYAIAALSEGTSEKGLYLYLKHCVLNEQETNRHGVNTWANEQSIREVYLKGFQIAIEDGGVEGVMTAYNAIGATWSGAQGFCKSVLHGEFGMTGIAVTDWLQAYMNLVVGVLNGNDLPDGQRNGAFRNYEKNYSEVAWAMRDSAHHILYTVVHSNAMNGVSAKTQFIKITPTWVTAVNAAKITVTVLAAISFVFLITMITLRYLMPRLVRKEEKDLGEINQ